MVAAACPFVANHLLPARCQIKWFLQSETAIDLGRVIINDRCVRTFCLTNAGNLPVEYEWEAGDDPQIIVAEPRGSIGVGERREMDVCFQPGSTQKLHRYLIKCKVQNGPSFRMRLSGIGHRPSVHLSTRSIDFGTVYVNASSKGTEGPDEGSSCLCQEVQLKNDDQQVGSQALRLDCCCAFADDMTLYFVYAMHTENAKLAAGGHLQCSACGE
jgi:hypothetical protein